ncbi:MAG TPA: DUF4276 family protein [Byssovorax sp.]
MTLKIIVEGGGNSRADQQQLRESMAKLISRALPRGAPKPKVTADGGRGNAFKEFKLALKAGEPAMLLVDSESVVVTHHSPWQHVASRRGDEWERPAAASEDDLHFMAAVMETWLAADPEAAAAYFGQGFKADKLPATLDLEQVDKAALYASLVAATHDTRKRWTEDAGKAMSSELVGKIDPAKVQARAKRFAPRFFTELKKRLAVA